MKIARKYKWVLTAFILASIGTCIGFVYADFQTDTKPVLKPSFIEPTTAAQKQKLTIPVQTEVKAHPAFYIYQDDSHNWRVDGSRTNEIMKNNPTYNLPDKGEFSTVYINTTKSEYTPGNTGYSDVNGKVYAIDVVRNIANNVHVLYYKSTIVVSYRSEHNVLHRKFLII